jgi:hypothetical protein
MSVKDDLIAAKSLIDTPEKWAKGTYETRNGCMCALGACRRQVYGNAGGGSSEDGELVGDMNPLATALLDALPNGETSVSAYNDRKLTTHADIMALFDRAIAMLAARTTGETTKMNEELRNKIVAIIEANAIGGTDDFPAVNINSIIGDLANLEDAAIASVLVDDAPTATDDDDEMVKISVLIARMQDTLNRFGDTYVYIRRGGLSWGAVALNRRDDDKKHGVFDLQATHDREMTERVEQIGRLIADRNEWREKAWAAEAALPSPPKAGE